MDLKKVRRADELPELIIFYIGTSGSKVLLLGIFLNIVGIDFL